MPRITIPPLSLKPGHAHDTAIALGDLGGLAQYGVRLQRLLPGQSSSMRHWHDREDEFVLVLEGKPTLVEDSGETTLDPGAAAAFPAGRPNGHTLENRGADVVRFLVIGWRDDNDLCRYSGRDRQFVKSPDGAGYTRRDGTPLREDDPTGPFDDPPYSGPCGAIDTNRAPLKTGSIYPAPYGAQMVGRSSLRLGEAGGLTQFGVNLVMLDPGARSSLRHWHMYEDEFVMVTQGDVTLIEDEGETGMRPGDCAAFPAGVANGHCFLNKTDAPAAFLVVGTKAPQEVATYSDIDLIVEIGGGVAHFTRKDGTPYRFDP